MTVHRFFVPDLDKQAGTGQLSSEQSRQVSRVLRLGSGDEICVFDGGGSEFAAKLTTSHERLWQLDLGVECWPVREPEVMLTVGLAVLRNERFDFAVQKLTELGVAAIVPIAAERCVISYKDAQVWAKRRTRLQRIVIEAAEQSERVTLPALHDPQTVTEFLRQPAGTEVFVLMERSSSVHISELTTGQRQPMILVGPEGGWSPGEDRGNRTESYAS